MPTSNNKNGYSGHYYSINDLDFLEVLAENKSMEGCDITQHFYLVHYKHTEEVHDDLSWQVRNRIYHYKRRGLVAEPTKLTFTLTERGVQKLRELKEQKVDYLHKLMMATKPLKKRGRRSPK